MFLKMRIPNAFLVLVLCSVAAVSFGAKPCDPDTWKLIAVTSAMMAAYPDELPEHVEKNRELLGEKGPFQGCLNDLIKRLTEKTLSQPSRKEIVKAAMDIASKHGRPELGDRVAEDFMDTHQELLKVAQYLNNTANAVSILLADDLERYRHVAFYQQNAFRWHEMRALFQPDDVAAVQKITNDLNVWYFLALSRGVKD